MHFDLSLFTSRNNSAGKDSRIVSLKYTYTALLLRFLFHLVEVVQFIGLYELNHSCRNMKCNIILIILKISTL